MALRDRFNEGYNAPPSDVSEDMKPLPNESFAEYRQRKNRLGLGRTDVGTVNEPANPVADYINQDLAPAFDIDPVNGEMKSLGPGAEARDIMLNLKVHDDPDVDAILKSRMAPEDLMKAAQKHYWKTLQSKHDTERKWYNSNLAVAKSAGTELFRSVGDIIQRGQFLVAGQVDAFIEGAEASEHFRRVGRAIIPTPTPIKEQYSFIDILGKAGVKDPVAKFGFGLILDIVLDPVTWVGAGLTKVGKAKGLLGKLAKGGDIADVSKVTAASKIQRWQSMGWKARNPAWRMWKKFFGAVSPEDALRVVARNNGIKTFTRKGVKITKRTVQEIVMDPKFSLEMINNGADLVAAIRAGEKGIYVAGRAMPKSLRKFQAKVVELARENIYGRLGKTRLGVMLGDVMLPNYIMKETLPRADEFLKVKLAQKVQAGEMTQQVSDELARVFYPLKRATKKNLLMLLQDDELMKIVAKIDPKTGKMVGTTLGDWMAKQAEQITVAVDSAMLTEPQLAESAGAVHQLIKSKAIEIDRAAFTSEFAAEVFGKNKAAIAKWQKLKWNIGDLLHGKKSKEVHDLRELMLDVIEKYPEGDPERGAVQAYRIYRDKLSEMLIEGRKQWGQEWVDNWETMSRMSEAELDGYWNAYYVFKNRMRAGARMMVGKGYMEPEQVIKNYVSHIKNTSRNPEHALGLMGKLTSELQSLRPNSLKRRHIIGQIEEINKRFEKAFFEDDILKIYYRSATADIQLKTVDDLLWKVSNMTDDAAMVAMKKAGQKPVRGMGWVQDIPKTGIYDRKKWIPARSLNLPKSNIAEALDGKLIHREIFFDLKRSYEMMSDPARGLDIFKSYWRDATNWWKAQTLMPHAGTHFRNKVDDMIRNWISDVDPLTYHDAHNVQWHYMKKGVDFDLPANVRGERLKASQLIEEFQRRGGFGSSFWGAEISPHMLDQPVRPEKAGEFMKYMAERGGRFIFQDINPMSRRSIWQNYGNKLWEWSENNSRLAHFIDRWSKGMNFDDAMQSVFKTLYNYDDVPRTIRMARKYTLPFSTFYYKNFPFVIANLFAKPGKFGKLEKATGAWARYVMEPTEKELTAVKEGKMTQAELDQRTKMRDFIMPDWLRDRAPVPVRRREDGTIDFFMAEGFISATDIAKVADPSRWVDELVAQLHPFLKVPIELYMNRDVWHRRNIVSHPSFPENSEKDLPWWQLFKHAVWVHEKQRFMGIDKVPARWKHILKSIRVINNLDRLTRPDLEAREKFIRSLGMNLYGVDPAERRTYHALKTAKQVNVVERAYQGSIFRAYHERQREFKISPEGKKYNQTVLDGKYPDSIAELQGFLEAFKQFTSRTGDKANPEAERVLKMMKKMPNLYPSKGYVTPED